jgi:hypothetical protein
MNMNKKNGQWTALLVLASFTLLTFFSCKKSGPTIAIVTVVDTLGRPVANANVRLWQDTSHSQQTGVQSNINVSKKSDGSGKAQFEFDLEAYLNIEAIKGSDSAKGFIRLVEHETAEKTVSF